MSPNRLQVAVIAGGYSSEYPISMKSAQNVMDQIDQERFEARIVDITNDGWHVWDHDGTKYPVNRDDFSWNNKDSVEKFDVVFNSIHGTPGEDGLIQSYFQLIGIPLTGCDAFCSALTFNKYYCNKFLKEAGILVANSVMIRAGKSYNADEIFDQIGVPCVVKPNNGGSSCGSSRVDHKEELEQAIIIAFKEDQEVLIESFLEGTEITCGVFNTTARRIVLPLTEVICKTPFFNYEAKYTPGLAEAITPAQLPDALVRSITDLSINICDLLGCRGIVRMDFILVDDKPHFLEVNTVPGMTRESIVPKQAAKHGLSLKALFSSLLDEALAR